MQVLLLKKRTSSAIQRESLLALGRRGVLPSIYTEEMELADMEHIDTLHLVQDILQEATCQVTEIYPTDPWPSGNYDFVVTLGGDGTVLHASHFLPDSKITIVGIRSSRSSIGKLCAFDYRDLTRFAHCLHRGKIVRVELKRLQAEITCNRGGTSKTSNAVLNDFLYTNTNPAAMTRYIINFDGIWESHKSSGIWVSTPAGSSAAVLAAGGRTTDFAGSAFQFRIRELYQTSGNKIVGQEFNLQRQKLTVYSLCDQALLSLDGQHRALPLKYGDTIEFKPAPPISIAKPAKPFLLAHTLQR